MFTRRHKLKRNTVPPIETCQKHTPRTLCGTTRCGGVTVQIFKNGDAQLCKDYDGNTCWRRGVMHIDISARLFEKPQAARLASVLLHEFVHVIEYCNSHEFLSPVTTTENCTEMAQAMEEGLGDIYKYLKGINFVFPQRDGLKPARRKRTQKP